MNKGVFIVMFLCFGIFALHAQNDRPNIIFLLADDAGYADYEPYNEMFDISDDVRINTPHVDRLADEGIMFTNAHSAGTVCQPTRYSIMTGRFSYRKLVTGNPALAGNPFIDSDEYTLPKMLQANGYQTAIFGKWHLDYAYQHKDNPNEMTASPNQFDHVAPLPITPNDYGFDYAFWLDKGVSACKWFLVNRYIVKIDGEESYNNLYPDRPQWKGHRRWLTSRYEAGEEFELLPPENREIIGDLLTDKALDYMEEAVANDKPFYVFLSSIAPHAPHLPKDSINSEPLAEGVEHFDGSEVDSDRQKMVYENDVILGQLMEQLERLGIEENTIVVFASDNGPGAPGANKEGSTGHFRGNKGQAWEGGHRIPLIIKWPGFVKPGTRSDQLVSLTDLFGTFADVAGDEIP